MVARVLLSGNRLLPIHTEHEDIGGRRLTKPPRLRGALAERACVYGRESTVTLVEEMVLTC